MPRLLPLYDNVIVRPARQSSTSDAGIEIFRRKEELTDQGTVVGAGPQAAAAVGDYVIFDGAKAKPLAYEGEKLLHVRGEHLSAVVEADTPEAA